MLYGVAGCSPQEKLCALLACEKKALSLSPDIPAPFQIKFSQVVTCAVGIFGKD
jgi:hypothetical protein